MKKGGGHRTRHESFRGTNPGDPTAREGKSWVYILIRTRLTHGGDRQGTIVLFIVYTGCTELLQLLNSMGCQKETHPLEYQEESP